MGCPRQVDGGQMFVLESESPSLVRTIRWPGSLRVLTAPIRVGVW